MPTLIRTDEGTIYDPRQDKYVPIIDLSQWIQDSDISESAVTQHEAAINHNALSNFDQNEHWQILFDNIGNRPAFGTAYRLFWALDEGKFYLDDGTQWVAMSLASTLDASVITTGTFDDARIAQTNVTQHEAAIDHNALANITASEHRPLLIDLAGNRPAAGTADRFFYATDTQQLSRDTGAAWEDLLVAEAAVTAHEAALTIGASQLTGTLADARLPAEVPLTDEANSFTAEQDFETAVVLKEITAPSNPSAGDQKLYISSADSKAYLRDSSGTETLLGPGFDLIQAQEISTSVAAVDFTGFVDSSEYVGYVFVFSGVEMDGNSTIYLRVSTDGGSTWLSSTGDYSYANFTLNSSTTSYGQSENEGGTDIRVYGFSTGDGGIDGEVRTNSLERGDIDATFRYNMAIGGHSTGTERVSAEIGTGSYVGATTAVDGVRFVASSGDNFADGAISLYGVKK